MVPVILIAMVLTCLVKEKPLAATTIWGLVPQTLQIDGMTNVRLEESTDREDAPTGFDHHWGLVTRCGHERITCNGGCRLWLALAPSTHIPTSPVLGTKSSSARQRPGQVPLHWQQPS